MPRPSRKDRILDAAERLIDRGGPGSLTLEAVAAEAKMTKGGLFYHFETKEQLLHETLARLMTRLETEHAERAAADSERAGRFTRAYLDVVAPGAKRGGRGTRATGALLAALVTEPELVAPLRRRYRDWQKGLEQDSIDPARAAVVRLAADGLWMSEMLGLAGMSPALRELVRRELDRLTRKRR